MSVELPSICDIPAVQSADLDRYVAYRLREGTLDLYSTFALSHEALRIDRLSYLQPAWGHTLSISKLLRLYMHCLVARALRLDTVAAVAEGWFGNDIPLLKEKRPHFFTDRLGEGVGLICEESFLTALSAMRDRYDSLSDDDGPYHVEQFPYDKAAPERELLSPGSQSPFQGTQDVLDHEAEDLIAELCSGVWA